MCLVVSIAVAVIRGKGVICAQNYSELLDTIGIFYYSPWVCNNDNDDDDALYFYFSH